VRLKATSGDFNFTQEKIPTVLIMSATGHKKEDMFLRYIGKTSTDMAKQLADYF